MTIILAELLETDQGTAMVASAALSYRYRRDLILSLSKGKLRGTIAQPRLNEFIGHVKGMNKIRNGVAHSIVIEKPGEQMHWSMRNDGAYQSSVTKVRADQVLNSSTKINSLANEGMEIANFIRPYVKAWRENNPPIDVVHRADEVLHPPANQDKS
jgi:hypothetical protein